MADYTRENPLAHRIQVGGRADAEYDQEVTNCPLFIFPLKRSRKEMYVRTYENATPSNKLRKSEDELLRGKEAHKYCGGNARLLQGSYS